MERIEVAACEVPAIGLGTWQLEGDACRRIVRRALELGYRHIDTAQGYGNEAEVGAAIRGSGVARGEIFLTTKAWPDHLVEDASCVDRSLERLQVDAVDLLLIHWPSPRLELEACLDALVAARDGGKARLIGVSNFPPGMLRRALARAPIVCNQVEHHPYLGQSELTALARRHGLLLAAYSPLARGDVARDGTLRDIGARHGKTAAQVALRWLVQQARVAAIPKASSEEHLAGNLDVFDFALTEEEVARIGRLDRGVRYIDPDFAPDWEG